MLRGLRARFSRRKRDQRQGRRELPVEERASGEEALETIEEEAAETTPSGMPRLKTDKL